MTRPSFERTRAIFESGIHEKLHLGAQLYVSLAGEVLIDEAFGEAREGVPMRSDSITLWFSAGKPVTAVAMAQLVEGGKLQWRTRVAEVIPEFAQRGKESINLWHLLTHTAGLRHADNLDVTLPWEQQIARLCELPLEVNWAPGERAGYHVWATWTLLGEIVRRAGGRPVDVFVNENIFLPLGIGNSWLEMDESIIARYGERLAFVYDTSGSVPKGREDWNMLNGMAQCRPGGNVRGPVRELGSFYEALSGGGRNILRTETVVEMTRHHRAGMFDETFQFQMDWGLGFMLNSNRDGFQMPYGYGRNASPDTFGHSGNQSSCAFADPAHQLVVAWVCNGQPGERKHQQRQRAINNAIYEDVGIEAPAST